MTATQTALVPSAALAAVQVQDAARGFWSGIGSDDLFWLALLVVFLTAVIGAVIRTWRRDDCLSLFQDHHATYLGSGGRTVWGDVRVTPRGLELLFDAPQRSSRGYQKTSALVYQDEAVASIALARTAEALSEEECRAREAQIRRTFRPGPVRRLLRSVRNFFNAIRDAFVRALSLFIGQLGRAGRVGAVVQQQKAPVDELGKEVMGMVRHAYEPLLERHIGRRVVVELTIPEDPPRKLGEYPGYLVEYTEDFIAIFNIDHAPEEVVRLDPASDVELEGFRLEVHGPKTRIECLGPRALVVRSVEGEAGRADYGVVLLPGTTVRVRRPGGRGEIEVALTNRVDLVCPRAVARIRFGSRAEPGEVEEGAPPPEGDEEPEREEWHGVAPEEEDQEGID